MINNIEKTPVLTEEQAKYLNYTITYENNENITTKQLVKKEEYVRLKVRVEYKKDISASDLPTNTETLNLIFTVNYIQADETAISVKDNGEKKIISSNGDINEIGTIVTIGDQQFYTIGTEGDNVKLLSMYNLYVGATNDSTTNTLTTYGSEATGLQDENMLGYRSNSTIHKGLTAFSSNTQKGENYNDYTGSIVEIYVNNYKNELEKMGINIVQARLITKDELISEKIGCSGSSCSNAPSWVYSSSYWTSSPSGTTDIWGMYGSSYFSIVYSYNKYFGVRPVIVISKSNF